MGRSPSFASTPPDYNALLRLAFAPAADLKSLTLPGRVTRRLIMQKARCHPITGLQPLVGARFQDLFHPLTQGTFHLSLTVLVHYRSLRSI
jgi:hypothetical protein